MLLQAVLQSVTYRPSQHPWRRRRRLLPQATLILLVAVLMKRLISCCPPQGDRSDSHPLASTEQRQLLLLRPRLPVAMIAVRSRLALWEMFASCRLVK